MTVENKYHQLVADVRQCAEEAGRNAPQLIAVTKGCNLEQVLAAYQAGCRDFGEARLPEAFQKKEQVPDDSRWHFIGSLQKNKVRKVVGHFSLIHAVDSYELAEKISEVSVEKRLKTAILLQANTSGEVSKHGLTPGEWKAIYKQCLELPGIEIQGLMTMAPNVEEEAIIRACFKRLRELRDELNLKHLSMGMTHDYKIAIQEGATLLRIGSFLFG